MKKKMKNMAFFICPDGTKLFEEFICAGNKLPPNSQMPLWGRIDRDIFE